MGLLFVACSLHAGTIIIGQGTTAGSFSQFMFGPGSSGFEAYVAAGWTMGATSYSNVTITADLEGIDPSGDTIDAYLDTMTGPGTTAGADEVANSLDISVPSGSYNTVTLFTGLSLSANTTYYLTLAPDGTDEITWGIDNNQPSPTTAAGVSEEPGQFCSGDGDGCASYPPASPFDGLDDPIFTVTSSSSAATPEPSSALLAAAGLGLFAFLRFRRA
jgi:MYXO-CTERM domain-containing protein